MLEKYIERLEKMLLKHFSQALLASSKRVPPLYKLIESVSEMALQQEKNAHLQTREQLTHTLHELKTVEEKMNDLSRENSQKAEIIKEIQSMKRFLKTNSNRSNK